MTSRQYQYSRALQKLGVEHSQWQAMLAAWLAR
jgi:cytochrome c2